jgi:hypothetical protein
LLPGRALAEDCCLTEEKASILTPFLPCATDLPFKQGMAGGMRNR